MNEQFWTLLVSTFAGNIMLGKAIPNLNALSNGPNKIELGGDG